MRTSSLFWARSIGFAAAAMVAAAGCGSGTDEPAAQDSSSEASTPGESAAATTAAPEQETEEATTVAAEPDPSGQQIEISGGPAGSWNASGSCSWTPDNVGPASSLWVVEDFGEDGLPGQLTVFLAWPFVLEDDTEPALIGSIVEPDDNLLTVIDADASFDDGTLTVVANVHDGIKTFDDPPDFVVTITCAL